MRFACAVAVAVTLLTVCRADPYRRNLSPLQFVRHVLSHEKAWRLVLLEKFRDLPPSPYADRFGESLTPGDGTTELVEGRPIAARVLREYSDIGSFVSYAAAALHRCLTCFVAKHLSFQSHYVIRLFSKRVHPGTIFQELSSFKDNIVVSLDKLAVVPADLELVTHLYWEVTRLMQYDVMFHMRFARYPPNAHKRLEDLLTRFGDYLRAKCTPLRLEAQFFRRLGISVGNLLILDDVLNVTVDEDTLIDLGRKHAAFLGQHLRNLNFETMPRSQWSQVFYTSAKMARADELDETNLPISPRISEMIVPKQQTPESASTTK